MKIIVTRRFLGSRWYIRIVAGNGETVAVTQRYHSRSNAARAARNLVDAARSEPWTMEVDIDA